MQNLDELAEMYDGASSQQGCCDGHADGLREAVWVPGMSDWLVPDDLADRVRRSSYADAWKLEIERTAEVRAILTDLIAELRQASGDDRWIHLPDGHYCTPVLPLTVAADRAEARLREVSGDE